MIGKFLTLPLPAFLKYDWKRGEAKFNQVDPRTHLVPSHFHGKGVDILELLVYSMIKKRDYINHLAEVIVEKLVPVLVRSFVRFMNEDHDGAPNASLIVDCTICPIRRSKLSFDEAKVCYSGKHCMYAIEKEVCVNIRSVTAALVSGGYPGSMPDIEIPKMQATEINTLLGGKSVLADLGYV